MIDMFRAAGYAVLMLGAAGASGQAMPTFSTEVPSATVIERLPSAAEATPLLVVEPAIAEIAPASDENEPVAAAPATSLAALVRRFATSTTADAEQDCLAGAIYFESKGEPLEGQLAVAKVIMNRAASGRFARTVCGVVFQRGQFSFVRGGAMPAIPRASSNWRTAVAIARVATDDLWAPGADRALFFHAKRVAPGWKMIRVASIGNHVFYR